MYMIRPITVFVFGFTLFLGCTEVQDLPWLYIPIGLAYLMLCLLLTRRQIAVRYSLWHIAAYILWCLVGIPLVKFLGSYLYDGLRSFFLESSIIEY